MNSLRGASALGRLRASSEPADCLAQRTPIELAATIGAHLEEHYSMVPDTQSGDFCLW